MRTNQTSSRQSFEFTSNRTFPMYQTHTSKSLLTFLPSNSCGVLLSTRSTQLGSIKVTNPNPLRKETQKQCQKPPRSCTLHFFQTCYVRQYVLASKAQNYSLYLDRFDTGSLITTHSFSSPYFSKYWRNPSEIENKNKTVTRRPESLGNTVAGPAGKYKKYLDQIQAQVLGNPWR